MSLESLLSLGSLNRDRVARPGGRGRCPVARHAEARQGRGRRGAWGSRCFARASRAGSAWVADCPDSSW